MHKKTAITTVIILAAGIMVLYFFAGAFARAAVEKMVAKRLTAKLGPAASYQVNADGGLSDLAKGKLDALHIRGNDVVVRSGLTISKLDIDAKYLTFDTAKRKITGVKSTGFTAYLTQDNLNSYLKKYNADVLGAKIVLTDNKLAMRADPGIEEISIPIEAEGGVHIENGTKLIVNVNKVSTLGIKIPAREINKVINKINPLLDTRRWPFHTVLNSAAIKDGVLVIGGNIDLARAASGAR